MQDCIDLVLAQQAQNNVHVTGVAHHEFGADDSLCKSGAQVVQGDDTFASLYKLKDDMASNVSGTSGYEYRVFRAQETRLAWS
jgi:hypothetical protein